jgi:hypothetical protein
VQPLRIQLALKNFRIFNTTSVLQVGAHLPRVLAWTHVHDPLCSKSHKKRHLQASSVGTTGQGTLHTYQSLVTKMGSITENELRTCLDEESGSGVLFKHTSIRDNLSLRADSRVCHVPLYIVRSSPLKHLSLVQPRG